MTDYDDFRKLGGGATMSPMPTVMAAYGMPAPQERVTEAQRRAAVYAPLAPPAPSTADTMVARMRERVQWLERELSQHEAWKLELATLHKMLTAYDDAASALAGDARKGGE